MKSKHSTEKLISKNLSHFTLSFEFCDEHDLPNDKNSFKKILTTLKCFVSEQELKKKNPHPLKNGSNNKELNALLKNYSSQSIISVDVGNRNGEQGNMRMLYYRDTINPTEIKVVSLWIDTH